MIRAKRSGIIWTMTLITMLTLSSFIAGCSSPVSSTPIRVALTTAVRPTNQVPSSAVTPAVPQVTTAPTVMQAVPTRPPAATARAAQKLSGGCMTGSTWEYKSILAMSELLDNDPRRFSDLVNPLGQQGWDLGDASTPLLVFKRPLSNARRWEYQVVDAGKELLGDDPQKVDDLFRPLGQAGWELSGATSSYFVFKRPASGAQKWEYHLVVAGKELLSDDPQSMNNLFRPLGRDGWELGGVTSWFFVFKRSISDRRQWEYQSVNAGKELLSSEPQKVESLFNPLGQAGWEMGGVTSYFVVFKRPVSNAQEWEYRFVMGDLKDWSGDGMKAGDAFAPLGQDRWELAGAVGYLYFFKRPVCP